MIIIFTDVTFPGFSRSLGAYMYANKLKTYSDVQVIDFFGDLSLNTIKKIKRKFKPDIVGFSSTFFQEYKIGRWTPRYFPHSDKYMRDLFKVFNGCKFIYGGVNTELLEPYEKMTWHEGEQRLWLDIRKHTWHENDLLFEDEWLPLETSKGCSFSCPFCCYRKLKIQVHKDLNELRQEITENYYRFGITKYMIVDSMFTTPEAEEKLKMFRDLPFDFKFTCFARVSHFQNLYDLEKWSELFLDAGCMSAYFGIESLNDETLKTIHKGPDVKTQLDILSKLRERWYGQVQIAASFIIGLPKDDLNWLDDLDKGPWDVHHIQPLRLELNSRLKSPFTENPEKWGYSFENGRWKTQYLDELEARKICFKYYFRDKNPIPVMFHYIGHVSNVGLSINSNLNNKETVELLLKKRSAKRKEYLKKLWKL